MVLLLLKGLQIIKNSDVDWLLKIVLSIQARLLEGVYSCRLHLSLDLMFILCGVALVDTEKQQSESPKNNKCCCTIL
jgi:hypothetical protein